MRWLLVLSVLAASASAQAQSRSTTDRARMEVALDHGYGGGSEGGFVELAIDLRLFAPEGMGFVLRTGAASNGLSNAIAADVGGAWRFDLVRGTRGGLQLSFAAGGAF